MNDGFGTVVQLAGFGCVVAAAFLVSTALGLVALGAVLIPAGHLLDGFDWRKARRDWRRRRRGIRKVS